MATVRLSRGGLSLRFGDSDTPAPEGLTALTPSPRIVVAVSPIDARTRVRVHLRSGERDASFALHATSRTREEQFFEGGFHNLRVGNQVDYSVRAEVERSGATIRLDSSEIPEGVRKFEVMGAAAMRGAVASARGALRANSDGPATRIIETPAPRAGAPSGGPGIPGDGSGGPGISVAMPNTSFVRLSSGSLGKTVVETLSGNSPDSVSISDTLNAALKAKLNAAGASINQPVLQQLVQGMTPADLAANKDLSIRAFVAKSVTLPADPAAKQVADAAIAKLSSTTTVGDLLGLDKPVNQNPLFRPEVAKVNIGTLLGTSPALASAELQDAFINRFASFQGSMPDFWKQLSGDAQFKAVVPELQFTLQLGALSLNSPSLVAALRSQYKPTSLRDLTNLDTPTLAQMIASQNVSVPVDFPGATSAEKATNYADAVVSLLKGAFPTDYVAHGLATATDAVNKGVATFLANSRDFDFGSTHVDSYLKNNSANGFKNVPAAQVPAVRSQIKAIQRVFRVNPEYSIINTLLSSGLDSAHKIASIPHSTFIQQYGSKLGGTNQAEMVYQSAQHVSGMTSHLYLRIKQAINDTNPRVLG